MKKFKWLLGMLVLALMPMLQSCDDDDGYSIGDFSWSIQLAGQKQTKSIFGPEQKMEKKHTSF